MQLRKLLAPGLPGFALKNAVHALIDKATGAPPRPVRVAGYVAQRNFKLVAGKVVPQCSIDCRLVTASLRAFHRNFGDGYPAVSRAACRIPACESRAERSSSWRRTPPDGVLRRAGRIAPRACRRQSGRRFRRSRIRPGAPAPLARSGSEWSSERTQLSVREYLDFAAADPERSAGRQRVRVTLRRDGAGGSDRCGRPGHRDDP